MSSNPHPSSSDEQRPDAARVVLRHPDVAALQPAVDLHAAVLNGRWSAVADLCAERLTDATAAGAELNLQYEQAGYTPLMVAPLPQRLDGDELTIEGTAAEVAEALNVFMRVLTGQWREIDWVSRWASRTFRDYNGTGVEHVRVIYQRDGAYPEVAGASWSISNSKVPLAGRMAYNVWKQLGGGVAGRDQLPLQHPIDVQVHPAP